MVDQDYYQPARLRVAADPSSDAAKAGTADDRGFLLTKRDSNTLMVSFGGRHEGFNFWSLAESNGYDALFFQDAKLDWYTSGVAGVSEDLGKACAYIRAVSRAGDYTTTFFIGQSSGGYAALRFALAVEPDACIVFAPQTRPITDDHQPSVNYPDAAVSRPHPALLDLAGLYRTRSSSFPVAIHLCESEASNPPEAYFWDDWAHVEGMQQALGVETWRQPCSVHPVAEYLTRTNQLGDVVDRFISVGQRRDG